MLRLLEGRVHYFKFCTGDFLPIYLLICRLHQYEPAHILDLSYNPILLDFVAQRVSALATGNSFSWLLCPCPFDMLPSIWFFFLFIKNTLGAVPPFRHHRVLQAHHDSIMHMSCPSASISHFPKESWLLLLENGIRNQNLGTRCAYYYWGNIALCPLSGDIAKKYVCTPSLVYTRTYK